MSPIVEYAIFRVRNAALMVGLDERLELDGVFG